MFDVCRACADIQFWRNRKSLEGLSVRSVFFNVFQSVVVLLYVMDNETNFVIKCSIFIGLGIEIWKIQKVVDFKVAIVGITDVKTKTNKNPRIIIICFTSVFPGSMQCT